MVLSGALQSSDKLRNTTKLDHRVRESPGYELL
jgi:hypothetical protein